MENPNFKTALHLMIESMNAAYELNQTKNHQLVLTLGQTPKILIDYGYVQLPVSITGKVIDKAYYDHGITKSILERTYKIIETPKAIYHTDNNDAPDGTVLLSYEVNKANDPLIIAIHPDKQIGGRKDQRYNNIASIYYKQNNPEIRWKDKGLLRWEAY